MGEKPKYVKLIWQGTLQGKTTRVVVSKLDEESAVSTNVECLDTDTMGQDCWVNALKWSMPSQLQTDVTIKMAYVVEGLVDLVGRPDWDKRGSGSARFYPLEIKVVE